MPPGLPDFELGIFTPYLLNRLVDRINVDYRKYLARRGLTLNHWRVLAALQHREPMLVTELAEVTVTDRTTLSRLLTRMEGWDLIRRRPCPEDGRSWEVRLTATGKSLFDDLHPVALDKAGQALRGLTAGEEAELLRLVLKALAPFEDHETIFR